MHYCGSRFGRCLWLPSPFGVVVGKPVHVQEHAAPALRPDAVILSDDSAPRYLAGPHLRQPTTPLAGNRYRPTYLIPGGSIGRVSRPQESPCITPSGGSE